VVAVAIKGVGTLLIFALLIIPAAAARPLCAHNQGQRMFLPHSSAAVLRRVAWALHFDEIPKQVRQSSQSLQSYL
jgi:ABC-type Mn2+/Zn2+ transport system permease subunit